MTVTVSGCSLNGSVTVPSSKSEVHRLLICAALSNEETVITDATVSQDITATVNCLQALGAEIAIDGNRLLVKPIGAVRKKALLDCGESGSTLRFLLPVASALGADARFTGRGRLPQRPLSPLYELLCDNGCSLSPQGAFPLSVEGRLCGDYFAIDGGVSSQFISGLLMAAPLLKTNVTVEVTGTVESRPYIDLTVAAMRRFGVTVTEENNVYRIASSGYCSPGTVQAEGDWSNGAFWLVAKALTRSDLAVNGLDENSLQGDRAIAEIIKSTDGMRVPLTVDAAQIPDLVPVLAVLAAAILGRNVIGNARRLRIKESDRLSSVCAMLTALGGTVTMGEDYLVVDGSGSLRGGTVDACNDHRIAMAAAVAACLCERPVVIEGAEAVQKSYPNFFTEYAKRGMSVCPPYSGET